MLLMILIKRLQNILLHFFKNTNNNIYLRFVEYLFIYISTEYIQKKETKKQE
jgi:hypothetical protein